MIGMILPFVMKYVEEELLKHSPEIQNFLITEMIKALELSLAYLTDKLKKHENKK